MENKSTFLFNSAAWLLIRFSSMASKFLNVHPDSICWQLYIFSGNSVQASSWVILDLILNESFSVTLSVTTLPINFKMVIWQGSSFACLLTSSLGISLPIHSSVFRKRSPGWFGSFKLRKVYTWPTSDHSFKFPHHVDCYNCRKFQKLLAYFTSSKIHAKGFQHLNLRLLLRILAISSKWALRWPLFWLWLWL